MALKIPFILANQCLTDIDSCTILEIKNVREIASVLIARHNWEEFVLKEMSCKHWDQEGKKFPKKVKILNDLKIQKQTTNIKKAVCNYDGLYSKRKSKF